MVANGYWKNIMSVMSYLNSEGLNKLVTQIVDTCGYGSILDVGSGDGKLVYELQLRGFDAKGIDISSDAIEMTHKRKPDSFFEGTVLSLPFASDQFDTVVCLNLLELLSEDDIRTAIKEISRVASKYVFLKIIINKKNTDNTLFKTIKIREWWERLCLQKNLRKHPFYYMINPYEALNNNADHICILLEKIPDSCLNSINNSEPYLVDMLRLNNKLSDALCFKYFKASELIRPGDSVLNVDCASGYGSHILYMTSLARSVTGVDANESYINYAIANYEIKDKVTFGVQSFDAFSDNKFDFITYFNETALQKETQWSFCDLKRVLKPSGRLVWSISQKRLNESEYSGDNLSFLLSCFEEMFLLECIYIQNVGLDSDEDNHRKWSKIHKSELDKVDFEWLIFVGMANPLDGVCVPYNETIWSIPDNSDFNVSAFARDYKNPWIVKGMISIGMRNSSDFIIEDLQKKVMQTSDIDSVDYGAALCGYIYSKIKEVSLTEEEINNLEYKVWSYAAIKNPSPHQLRWQVSLLFVGGELAKKYGKIEDAISFFAQCSSKDVSVYSPLLGNKILDALYWLTVFALNKHDIDLAKKHLYRSVTETQRLLMGSWLNIMGDYDKPLPFGFAEAAQLCDKASRAAYLLAVLNNSEITKDGMLGQEFRGYYDRLLYDRDNRLREKDSSIDNLLTSLEKLNIRIKELAGEVISQDEKAQSLAQEVMRQDQRAQSLAQEVMRQDQRAQSLVKLLSEKEKEISKLKRNKPFSF